MGRGRTFQTTLGSLQEEERGLVSAGNQISATPSTVSLLGMLTLPATCYDFPLPCESSCSPTGGCAHFPASSTLVPLLQLHPATSSHTLPSLWTKHGSCHLQTLHNITPCKAYHELTNLLMLMIDFLPMQIPDWGRRGGGGGVPGARQGIVWDGEEASDQEGQLQEAPHSGSWLGVWAFGRAEACLPLTLALMGTSLLFDKFDSFMTCVRRTTPAARSKGCEDRLERSGFKGCLTKCSNLKELFQEHEPFKIPRELPGPSSKNLPDRLSSWVVYGGLFLVWVSKTWELIKVMLPLEVCQYEIDKGLSPAFAWRTSKELSLVLYLPCKGKRIKENAMGARMLLQIAVGLALLKVLHATAPTGQVFITAFMQNYKLDYSEAQFQLFISGHLPSTLVSVWICKLYQMSKLTIFRGQTAVVKIPTYLEMGGTAKLCKTVMVKSSGHVTVLAFSSKKNSADTMVVYPVNQLGVEYYVLTPLGEFPNTYKEFSVIAWEKQTKVEIHLKGKVSFRKKTYPAGSKLNVVLSPYEAIQLQSLEDLSGTFIKSEKPVAVLSGHTCAQKNTHCNHVMEQLLPVPIWGRVFIIPPLSFQMNFDLAYVVASQTTSLTCVSGGLHRNYNLVAGQVLQLKVTHSSPIYITANVGIQVFLFCTGGIHSHLNFDPYFISIPDTSRYCRHYSVKEQVNFENYVHIIAKTTAIGGITIDKHSLGVVSWRPIPGTEYSWSEYYLGEEGTSHELFDPVNHFGVLSFGLAERNAYGSAGLCKTDLQHFPPSSCRSIRCQKNHFCQMINDKPICMSSSTATCRAQGDPHYQTFDKRQYNFMGTCTYTMAKTCGPDATFPAFHITAKNEKRGTQSVSYVGLVMVQVYGYNISVARSEYGLVRVNNQRSRLPISLHDGRLRLYQRGTSVFVATDFSLWVSYDWNSQLLVKISRSFSEKICGLCGNYNGNPTDDFRTPSGSLALSPEEFGKSWKVEDGDKLCWSDCRGECSEVTTNMLKKYKAEPFCGWISKRKNGPFSQCHPLVDPKIFLENCAYDLYIYKGHQEVLCQALKSYADACQSEGATLSDWRRLTGCSLSCPENSQYMLCGSACPATCNNQALPPDCNSSQCMETCECNEGFVLDAGQCIPQAACGCLFEDRLLSPNEQFWGDSTCTRHCICDPRSRQVQCQPASCKDGQQCKVENGLQDCYPTDYAKCSAFGYSHYHSFDGQSFNFQGTCLYTLTGLSKKSQGLIDFQVLVQNAGQVGGPISLNKLVKVQVYGLEILVSWAYRGRVMVNGLLTNLPYKRGLDQILIYQKGWHAVIRTDFDVTITFDWQSHVTVTVPNTYKDALGGLCSNFNGHRQDDLISRDAMPAANPTALGQRWKVAESPGCRELNPKVCPDFQRVAQHQRSTSVECGVLVDKRGPFRGCHGTINPEVFFLDCVYDYCTYGGRQAVLVHVVAAYVAACQAMQVTIYAWRDHLLWKPTCLQNSHYELCTESCQQACSSLHWPLLCSTHCTEGCFCDKGFMLSGDRCVPMDQCGCMYQGQYYLAGETFFPTSKCNLECVCQVGGAVTCKEFSCGPYEECRVVDGTRKCHPVGLATCTAYGDPHYISFDGVRFDFQGTCTYILAKAVLTGKRDLTPFTVMQENETWKKKNVSVTKMVSVEAYGNTVALLQKKKGVVKVSIFIFSRLFIYYIVPPALLQDALGSIHDSPA
ncbi:IgGFc-binding protein [Varanus komodoensis]|nr:IgGFc-binding protein [Varanus komodoensis]